MPPSKVYAHDGEDIVIEKKTSPAASKTEEKGGWSDEIRSPTMILRQTVTRGTSLAHPDGEVHEIDALRPYRLVGCGGDAGRGRGELLGECGSAYIFAGRRPVFHTWAQFKEAMVQ